MLYDTHCLFPLLEVLDCCTYPFFLPGPTIGPTRLPPALSKVALLYQTILCCCVDLSFHLIDLACSFLFPLLLHLWGSHWIDIFFYLLDLLPVLIECLCDEVDIFLDTSFYCLCAVRDAIIHRCLVPVPFCLCIIFPLWFQA
jgi:hypothetical protein